MEKILKICKIQKKVQKVIQFSSLGFLLILLMASCEKDMSPFALHDNSQPTVNPIPAPDIIIPLPVSDVPTGKLFTLTKKTNIYISPDIQALREIGHYLADKLMSATGYEIRILPATLDILPEVSIWLTTKDGNPSLGEEGYELNVTQKSITLFAFTPCGVFRGIQTLRQIFPSSIEAPTIQPGPWQIVTRTIPGPYIHIGGDETYLLSDSDYNFFIQKADSIVRSYGKRMVGWEEIARANISSSSISQHWHSSNLARTAVQKGLKIVMSPATKAYMDMKYNNSTPLGLTWAGYTNVQDAYTWNPATQIDGVAENMIMGVEAPLWTETIQAIDDIEFMTFPRLPGYAEIGWTPEALRDWDTYKIRLGSHGPKLEVMGINFYYSLLVPWRITDSLAVATAG